VRVAPHWDNKRDNAHPPEPDEVRRAFEQAPDAKAMLLITPTDWGSCADIATIARICHDNDAVLIVDEAWGAHLPFRSDLPEWGMNTGADLVVTSVHKMGSAVEQSSVFHLQGDRVNPDVLSGRADILSTTSPSSLVYASLDGWRRQMVEDGERLLGAAMARAARIKEAVAALPGVEVMGREIVEEGRAFEQDPLKIVVDVTGLGITGYQALEWARANCCVDFGAGDTRRLQGQITHGDTDETERRFVDTLRQLVERADEIEPPPQVDLPPAGSLSLELGMRPRDAFFGPAEQVSAKDAVGRIAAEMISPYPPGVPAVAPGEVINQEVVDYLVSGVRAGMLIPDAADASMDSFRVVAR
jgi:arginine/lysine/ornithine decarboxylase